MICLHEHQNELEKLQKAALLIEEMSMGRLKVCPSTVGHVYIRPESDAYIGLQMQIAPESTPGRYAVTFTDFPRRMGLELGSSGLRRLMTEVNQSYALLTALEMPHPVGTGAIPRIHNRTAGIGAAAPTPEPKAIRRNTI